MCICAKNIKVSDFGDFTVNANTDSTIYLNHESKGNCDDISINRLAYVNLKKACPEQIFFCLTMLTGKLIE